MSSRYIKSYRRYSTNISIKSATIERNQKTHIVQLKYSDGFQTQFDGIWLRDHCKCINCQHQITKQRLLDTSKIPLDIHPKNITILNPSILQIQWPDDHYSQFDLKWLRQNSYSNKQQTTSQSHQSRIFWGSELSKTLPVVEFRDVMQSKNGLREWLNHLDTYGLGFVDNVPTTPKDTEALARRIAFVRETHYGSFWDFTSNLEHGDTAYTNLALSAHTDTTYFTDPAGLQCFHLLHHHGQGGKSLFVDGFNVAKQLLIENPEAFHFLCNFKLSSHSAGDADVFIQPSPKSGYPILNLDPITKELYQIRYNNDDRSVIKSGDVKMFYKSLLEWSKRVKNPQNELWMKLKPGRCVMFNNWRVMHGRTSFTGSRRLVGCYIGMDDFQSRLKIVSADGVGKNEL